MDSTPNTTQEGRPQGALAPLHFDAATYRQFLDDCEWTDAQKDAFVDELWKIILNFVDLGFQSHPVQQALASRKPLDDRFDSVLDSANVSNIFNRTCTELTVASFSASEDS